ncbi:CaiB/BaiF CoA transferase family protein [Agrococcus baldri]|nr:CoA transferase [Agrococcus baldri]
MTQEKLPLHAVRVLDLTDGFGELTTRYLADLGADVVRVEWDAQSASRTHEPVVRGTSTYHEAFNANKRSLRLDLREPEDRRVFDGLLAKVDIVVTSFAPRVLAELDLEPARLREGNPHLVAVALTHFGLTGPWRDWEATEWTHLALGGALSRSGAPGREPLLPPLDTAMHGAAVQAAWATIAAYSNRLVHGTGDVVDVSALEAVVQVLDPGYGMAGSASGGMPAADGPRGRTDSSFRYPFFQASDGAVRITILSPRQWAGMFAWLGSPEQFAGEEWVGLGHRFANSDTLYPEIQKLFSTLTRAEIISGAATHGIPAASVLLPAEILQNEHYAARGAFREIETAAGTAQVVDGLVEIDDERAGIRTPAPELGADSMAVLEEYAAARPEPEIGPFGTAPSEQPDMPFAGVRVLDFGVIVAGGEGGRLFGDLGADVIKVENQAVPDGSRQSQDGAVLSPVFSWGNRNKDSLGIDVRSEEGAALMRQLVAEADIILSNFKPGTLDRLGLGYAQLREINAGIITVESSAFGHTGPWSVNPGYGPIVRAAVGVAGLWQYHDDPSRYYDDVTIYPDHAAARAMAVAAAAALIRRRATGIGGTVRLAQTEVSLSQHAHRFAAESLQPGTTAVVGNIGAGDAPRGVYAAQGDDEWVVVDVRTDAHFRALADVTGLDAADARFASSADRAAHRTEIDDVVAPWIAERDPAAAMEVLQAAGVPAGKMTRLDELLSSPQLVAREAFQIERHPLIEREMPSEGQPATFERLPRVAVRPAPVFGQHTRAIAARLLGLDEAEIERLIDAGVLQEDRRGLAALAATAELAA